RLGDRRPIVRAPVDGLPAAEDVALLEEPAEDVDHAGLVARVERQVRIGPAAEDPERLEAAAVPVDVLPRELLGPPPDLGLLPLRLLLQHLVLDLLLDRQAVAVPARDEGRV